ncbi:hypothetical protein CTA2_1340, partial [Colletotrichum tanaceti]
MFTTCSSASWTSRLPRMRPAAQTLGGLNMAGGSLEVPTEIPYTTDTTYGVLSNNPLQEKGISSSSRRRSNQQPCIMGKKDPEAEAMANHVSGQANRPISRPAHALTVEQVVQELRANPDDGLTPDDAKARLDEYGRNEFGEEAGVQPLKIFVGQIANAMTL